MVLTPFLSFKSMPATINEPKTRVKSPPVLISKRKASELIDLTTPKKVKHSSTGTNETDDPNGKVERHSSLDDEVTAGPQVDIKSKVFMNILAKPPAELSVRLARHTAMREACASQRKLVDHLQGLKTEAESDLYEMQRELKARGAAIEEYSASLVRPLSLQSLPAELRHQIMRACLPSAKDCLRDSHDSWKIASNMRSLLVPIAMTCRSLLADLVCVLDLANKEYESVTRASSPEGFKDFATAIVEVEYQFYNLQARLTGKITQYWY
jgi:hypothetical protein